jgi:hypothetical protein
VYGIFRENNVLDSLITANGAYRLSDAKVMRDEYNFPHRTGVNPEVIPVAIEGIFQHQENSSEMGWGRGF